MKLKNNKRPKLANLSMIQKKKFSEELNQTFAILNTMTKTNVFESYVSDTGHLCIRICGRDSVFDSNLNCIDAGMWGDNGFIEALTGVDEEPPHPLRYTTDSGLNLNGETILRNPS